MESHLPRCARMSHGLVGPEKQAPFASYVVVCMFARALKCENRPCKRCCRRPSARWSFLVLCAKTRRVEGAHSSNQLMPANSSAPRTLAVCCILREDAPSRKGSCLRTTQAPRGDGICRVCVRTQGVSPRRGRHTLSTHFRACSFISGGQAQELWAKARQEEASSAAKREINR